MTSYRQWHKRLEWCEKCDATRAINRYGLCPVGHQIHADSQQIVPVGNSFRRGALSLPLNCRTHAQAANWLLRWNRQDSWRTIAQKLLRHRYVNYDNGRVDAVATMLAGYARREHERDEVSFLLGFKPPKRYRGHVEYGYGDPGRRRKARVEAALAARGYDSLTAFVEAALL